MTAPFVPAAPGLYLVNVRPPGNVPRYQTYPVVAWAMYPTPGFPEDFYAIPIPFGSGGGDHKEGNDFVMYPDGRIFSNSLDEWFSGVGDLLDRLDDPDTGYWELRRLQARAKLSQGITDKRTGG